MKYGDEEENLKGAERAAPSQAARGPEKKKTRISSSCSSSSAELPTSASSNSGTTLTKVKGLEKGKTGRGEDEKEESGKRTKDSRSNRKAGVLPRTAGARWTGGQSSSHKSGAAPKQKKSSGV